MAEEIELDALRQEANALGIRIDGRWSATRLRDEIAAAKASTFVAPNASMDAPKLPAGASTHPDVHYLIANRRAHEMILADPNASAANRQSAEESIADIDRQLGDHGYQ